jgi:hypothetical protein
MLLPSVCQCIVILYDLTMKRFVLRLALRGVWLKDGLMWLALKGRNRSAIDFKPDLLRCRLVDVKRVGRRRCRRSMCP